MCTTMSQKTIPKLFDFMDDETFVRIYDLNMIFFLQTLSVFRRIGNF